MTPTEPPMTGDDLARAIEWYGERPQTRQIEDWRIKAIAIALRAVASERAKRERLEAALREWKCGSCGGKTLYTQRTKDGSEIIPCKMCGATGLHPIARQALDREDA